MRISPDGRTIATLADDYSLYVWNTESGECTWRVNPSGGKNSVYALAFSPDGKSIATGLSYTKLYETQSGKMLCEFKTPKRGNLRSVCFSSSGKEIAAFSSSADSAADNTIRVWEISSGKCKEVKKLKDTAQGEIAWPEQDILVVLSIFPNLLQCLKPEGLKQINMKELAKGSIYENLIVRDSEVFFNLANIFKSYKLKDLEFNWEHIFDESNSLPNFGRFDVSSDGKIMLRVGKPDKKLNSSELILFDLEKRKIVKTISLPKVENRKYIRVAMSNDRSFAFVTLGKKLFRINL